MTNPNSKKSPTPINKAQTIKTIKTTKTNKTSKTNKWAKTNKANKPIKTPTALETEKIKPATGPEQILEALAHLNKALQAQKNTPVDKMLRSLEKSLEGENSEQNLQLDPDLFEQITKIPTQNTKTKSQTKPEKIWGQNQRQIQLTNSGEIVTKTESSLLNEAIESLSKKNPQTFLKNIAEIQKKILETPYGSKEILMRDLEETAWLSLAYLQIQTEENQITQTFPPKTKKENIPHHPNIQAAKEKLLDTFEADESTWDYATTLFETKNLEKIIEKNSTKALKKTITPISTREAICLSQTLSEELLRKKFRIAERHQAPLRALLTSLHFEEIKKERNDGNSLDRKLTTPPKKKKNGSLLLQYTIEGCRVLQIPNQGKIEEDEETPEKFQERVKKIQKNAKEILFDAGEETKIQQTLRPIFAGLAIGILISLIIYASLHIAVDKRPKENPSPLQTERNIEPSVPRAIPVETQTNP
jgi:hypothetical protein